MAGTTLSNRIRELRFHTGEMTQKQLAELVGVSRQTIVAIEKAKYAPSLDLAFKIATVFRTRVDEVFFEAPTASQANDEEPLVRK